MNKPIPGAFAGFHNFNGKDKDKRFEVFWTSEPAEGWYWWRRTPNNSPEGKPSGPFPSPEGAYLDAIGD